MQQATIVSTTKGHAMEVAYNMNVAELCRPQNITFIPLVVESLWGWLTTALAKFERITLYLACLQYGLALLLVRRIPCRPTLRSLD